MDRLFAGLFGALTRVAERSLTAQREARQKRLADLERKDAIVREWNLPDAFRRYL